MRKVGQRAVVTCLRTHSFQTVEAGFGPTRSRLQSPCQEGPPASETQHTRACQGGVFAPQKNAADATRRRDFRSRFPVQQSLGNCSKEPRAGHFQSVSSKNTASCWVNGFPLFTDHRNKAIEPSRSSKQPVSSWKTDSHKPVLA